MIGKSECRLFAAADLCGMVCNLCVESHARNVIEHVVEVVIVADAITGAGAYTQNTALMNYDVLVHQVVTTSRSSIVAGAIVVN